jgi:hypothetical protein
LFKGILLLANLLPSLVNSESVFPQKKKSECVGCCADEFPERKLTLTKQAAEIQSVGNKQLTIMEILKRNKVVRIHDTDPNSSVHSHTPVISSAGGSIHEEEWKYIVSD